METPICITLLRFDSILSNLKSLCLDWILLLHPTWGGAIPDDTLPVGRDVCLYNMYVGVCIHIYIIYICIYYVYYIYTVIYIYIYYTYILYIYIYYTYIYIYMCTMCIHLYIYWWNGLNMWLHDITPFVLLVLSRCCVSMCIPCLRFNSPLFGISNSTVCVCIYIYMGKL